MAEVYRFGRFTLEPAERRLSADGAPVPLGSTDFRLLLVLVESAGAVVAKNDLLGRVWGRSAVGDQLLYVHVNTLRKILGDDFIVNKQGLGYRFAAPVRRSDLRAPRARAELGAGNLPALWTDATAEGPGRLIGRSEQLNSVSERLARARLVTLIGPGGVGKTRLALQAASDASSRFADGAWLVELATLNDPELVPGALASVLGVKIGDNAAPLDVLSRFLAQKSLLILLDNCEHLRAACAHVSETLLCAAPGLGILATSREALSCSGEQVLKVPSLDLPHEETVMPDALRKSAALELFLERAQSADSQFRVTDDELVLAGRICRRVDGLPLAIEMVAGWAGILGLEMLDTKLDGSLRAWLRARSTAPSRHSTLHATLEWSYGLLSEVEKTVLCRLAVFAGSFSLQAAQAVAEDATITGDKVFEAVAGLIRKSMIAIVPGSRAQRYRLLETTRAFMLEKLATAPDAQATRRRHASYVLNVLETAKREAETTSDAVWHERYEPLLDDLRSALDWAMNEDSDEAVAIAGASWLFWRQLSLRDVRGEGRRRLTAAAGKLRPETPPALEARLRRGLSDPKFTPSKSLHDEIACAVCVYRALPEGPDLGCALTASAHSLFMLGRMKEAEQAIREALNLLEPAGWPRTLAAAYSSQIYIEAALGRFELARTAGEKAAQLCEMIGAERLSAVVAGNMVELSIISGDLDEAVAAARSLARRVAETSHYDIGGYVLVALAAALTARGDLDDALAAARDAAPPLRDFGRLYLLFDHLALCATLGGRSMEAAQIAGYADAVHEEFGLPREPLGQRAAERTSALLREALIEDEIGDLRRMGALLTENQALALALAV